MCWVGLKDESIDMHILDIKILMVVSIGLFNGFLDALEYTSIVYSVSSVGLMMASISAHSSCVQVSKDILKNK